MKYLIALIPLFVCASAISSSVDDIFAKHKEINSIAVSYEVLMVNSYPQNPEVIEDGSKLKERALKNELNGATVDDVLSYYEKIKQLPRQIKAVFTFVYKNGQERRIITSPKGELYPYPYNFEFILEDDYTIEIDHSGKRVNIKEGEIIKPSTRFSNFLSPLLIAYPLSAIQEEKASVLQ